MPKRFLKVDGLIQSGVEPTQVARSGRLILRGAGKSSVTLADARGKLTEAGRHYFESTGKAKPRVGFDEAIPLERSGGREYIKYRDGSLKLARTWNPGKSDFVYTRLGKRYFELRGEVEEYVVHLPVVIDGRNKKTGAAYQRFGHLPHSAISGLGTIKIPKGEKDKHARLRESILSGIDAENLLELSDEKYRLQVDGNWRISKLTTKVAEGGRSRWKRSSTDHWPLAAYIVTRICPTAPLSTRLSSKQPKKMAAFLTSSPRVWAWRRPS